MRRLFWVLALVSLCAGAAWSHDIGLYADTNGFTCALTTLLLPPGNNAVYILHKFNPGSTASQFKVHDQSGLFAASQTTTYLSLGTWNTDLSLAYGGCVIGEHVIMTLNFFWFGTPIVGCTSWMSTEAAPTSPIPGEIALVDCALPSGNLLAASGGVIHFGPQAGGCAAGIDCGANPVSESTWGSVKALYR